MTNLIYPYYNFKEFEELEMLGDVRREVFSKSVVSCRPIVIILLFSEILSLKLCMCIELVSLDGKSK